MLKRYSNLKPPPCRIKQAAKRKPPQPATGFHSFIEPGFKPPAARHINTKKPQACSLRCLPAARRALPGTASTGRASGDQCCVGNVGAGHLAGGCHRRQDLTLIKRGQWLPVSPPSDHLVKGLLIKLGINSFPIRALGKSPGRVGTPTGSGVQWLWGLPRPRPRPPGGASTVERGFLMVSSTDTMRQAASEAAVSALMRTMAGSHTQASKLSAMSSLLTSTPYHMPPWQEREERKRSGYRVNQFRVCTLRSGGMKTLKETKIGPCFTKERGNLRRTRGKKAQLGSNSGSEASQSRKLAPFHKETVKRFTADFHLAVVSSPYPPVIHSVTWVTPQRRGCC